MLGPGLLVDTGRVGVFGGSYGGFMSAWAVTQTDRFAASIPLAAVTDWRSFHLTTNIGRFDELFLDADPYEVGGEYDARSPVVQAKKCKTPTLMVHGEEDLCVPVSQAQEMYRRSSRPAARRSSSSIRAGPRRARVRPPARSVGANQGLVCAPPALTGFRERDIVNMCCGAHSF